MTKTKASSQTRRKSAKAKASISKPVAKPVAKAGARRRIKSADSEAFLEALREHHQVVEADHAGVDLPPGVNYVLVRGDEESEPELVERRKSFI